MSGLDQTQINTLAAEVDEAVRFNILSKASELSGKIKNTLKGGGLNAELSKALNHYLVELKFVRFLAVSEDELVELLTHHILDCYSIPDFELVQRFGDRFSLLTFPDDQAEFLRKSVLAFEANDELLGQKPITINGKQVSQTIGNWIAYYNSIPAKQLLRGPLEAIGFVQKNANDLSDEEKIILNDLLKLYNGSKNWLNKYDNTPEIGEDEDIPDNVILDLLYGPEENPQPRNQTAQSVPRSIDGVKKTPQAQPQQVKQEPKISAEQAPVNPETAGRLQELLKKNLSSSTATPQSNDAPTEIEQKLAELKKRVSKE